MRVVLRRKSEVSGKVWLLRGRDDGCLRPGAEDVLAVVAACIALGVLLVGAEEVVEVIKERGNVVESREVVFRRGISRPTVKSSLSMRRAARTASVNGFCLLCRRGPAATRRSLCRYRMGDDDRSWSQVIPLLASGGRKMGWMHGQV
jgi:5-methylcytosine-specific restriction endonuclease McrA